MDPPRLKTRVVDVDRETRVGLEGRGGYGSRVADTTFAPLDRLLWRRVCLLFPRCFDGLEIKGSEPSLSGLVGPTSVQGLHVLLFTRRRRMSLLKYSTGYFIENSLKTVDISEEFFSKLFPGVSL